MTDLFCRSAVQILFEQLDPIAESGQVGDLYWPLHLCIGNIINEILLGYHWMPDNCEQFKNFKKDFDYVIKHIRSRLSVVLVESYPWLINFPYIGWYGFRELNKRFDGIGKFMKKAIDKRNSNLSKEVQPTDLASVYLHEKKFGSKNDMTDTANFSSVHNFCTELTPVLVCTVPISQVSWSIMDIG